MKIKNYYDLTPLSILIRKGDDVEMDDTAICSQCGNEVKLGYIFTSHRILWTESEKPVFMDDGSEVLVKGSFFRMHKTPAYRCEGCKLVTFQYR